MTSGEVRAARSCRSRPSEHVADVYRLRQREPERIDDVGDDGDGVAVDSVLTVMRKSRKRTPPLPRPNASSAFGVGGIGCR